MIGTLMNAGAVVAAGLIGARLGGRVNARVRETALDGLGLVVVVIGLQTALETRNMLLVLASIVLGGAGGAAIDIEQRLERVSVSLERHFSAHSAHAGPVPSISQGFVTASLVFCVGPMTVLGSIQDGLIGDFRTLAVKSLLDFVAGLAFASTMGVGVALSAVTVLVYQGALTILASALRDWLTDAMIREMSATGGVLIIGIGLRLLAVKLVPVGNLLPAIAVAPLLQWSAGPWLDQLMRGVPR